MGSHLTTLGILFAITIVMSGISHARCGDQVRVAEGDTLSSIAGRCGVTEARILDLNPKIEGSRDLQAGMTLELAAPSAEDLGRRAREAADGIFDRLKSYASEAGESLEGAASTVTRSVEEFIQRNPDLHQRVRKLGQRLNIPGMEKVEAQVSLSVRKGAPGTPVTLWAIGLPPNQRVEIAGGAPDGDYTILESTRTSAEGTLQITLQVPERADPQRGFIFVIASPELNVAARSAIFDVVETTGSTTPRTKTNPLGK
jgi:LysM repeat protein